jgi:hypothetical protein
MMPTSVGVLVHVAVRHLHLGHLGVAVASLVGLLAGLRLIASARHTWGDAKPREVTFGPEGITVEGMAPIARGDIAAGWFQPGAPPTGVLVPQPAPPSIVVVDHRQRVVFHAVVADEAEALALLGSLGLDASQRRVELRGASPSSEALWVVLMMLLFVAIPMLERIHAGALVPFLLLCLPMLALLSIPASIVVGTDGISYKWLGWKRFLPLADIALVTPLDKTRIRVAMKDGSVHTLSTGRNRQHGERPVQHRDAVLARINEAIAVERVQADKSQIGAIVGRQGRSTEAWSQALTALAADGGKVGYRDAAVPEDALVSVIQDEDVRAGAAVALRRSSKPEAKVRVRVAADATASPTLRAALDAVESDSDEAVLEALAALEGERTSSQRLRIQPRT